VWSLCLLAAMCVLVYFLTKTINDYTDHDVITNVNVYREEEAKFPAVSFCINSNNISVEPEHSILFCQFNFKKCNISEFEVYTSLDKATTCFRFNTRFDEKKTTRSDSLTGLNVFLYTEQSLDEGLFKVSVLVQNRTTLFTRGQVYNINSGLLIPSGATAISIERKFVQKLSKPFNDCVKQDATDFDSETFQFFLKSNLTYLQKDCIDKCIQVYLLEICNCTLIDNNCNQCLTENLRNDLKNIPQSCLNECPIECDSIDYNLTPYYAGPFLDPKFLSRVREFQKMNESFDEFKQKLVYISVFYSSLVYTMIKEIPKTEVLLFDFRFFSVNV